MNGCWYWHEWNIFAINLIELNIFAYCVTFCNRRSAALSSANTVALIIVFFVLLTMNQY